jgi:hypothetical protein
MKTVPVIGTERQAEGHGRCMIMPSTFLDRTMSP